MPCAHGADLLLVVLLASGNIHSIASQGQNGEDEGRDCHHPLGVANSGLFPVYWLYASDGHAFHGRLNHKEAWRSHKHLYRDEDDDDNYSWIQVDLRELTLVTGVQTQGDPRSSAWVTWYRLWRSDNCEEFTPVLDAHNSPAKLQGNFDQNTIITTFLHDVVVTRCLRLIPTDVTGNYSAVRLELLGCSVEVCQEAVAQHMQSEEFPQTLSITNSTATLTYPKLASTNLPTLVTSAFAEFKFHTEHIIFGVVFYTQSNKQYSADRYVITYSRNCYTWEPLRETKGYGDPKSFLVRRQRFKSQRDVMPYPVRAHCIRVIPTEDKKGNRPLPADLRANFIGCSTGSGIIHTCGQQKRLVAGAPVRNHGDLRRRGRARGRGRFRRVVGGQPTEQGQFPWLVSLQVLEENSEKNTHVCGGSLIHPQWVLTAGHCISVMYTLDQEPENRTRDFSLWQDPVFLSHLRVRIGEYSLDMEEGTHLDARVEMVYPHVDYNVSYYINDLALIKLTKPVRLTDHVNTVCLTQTMQPFPNGTMCTVAGWGTTDNGFPGRPHFVQVPLVGYEDCQKMYSHLVITPDMLCAAPEEGGKDACSGDSGGPLICQSGGRWYQVGVASWNIGCGTAGYPGVYSRTAMFIDWMYGIIAANP